MAAHRKQDRRRDDVCAVEFGKRVPGWSSCAGQRLAPFSFLKHKRLIYYQRGGAKAEPIEDPFLPSEIHSPQPKNQAN